jgi:hypoxanthine phosphoribosyltransferase
MRPSSWYCLASAATPSCDVTPTAAGAGELLRARTAGNLRRNRPTMYNSCRARDLGVHYEQKIDRLYTEEAIARRIGELAIDIRRDAGEAEVFLLGILKGASCFLTDLMRAVPGPVGYAFIDVIRDPSDTETATALEIDFLSYTDIAGRSVYVLKDVISTGIIENYLMSQLRLHNPASLKLVGLLDRPGLRTVDVRPDFRAFEVEEGVYAGYGLEFDGRFGNLPYIGKVRL